MPSSDQLSVTGCTLIHFVFDNFSASKAHWIKFNFERAIPQSNIVQFSKLRTFLKSEFCEHLKNDQNIYPSALKAEKLQKTKCLKY